jgi:hypothetical protein
MRQALKPAQPPDENGPLTGVKIIYSPGMRQGSTKHPSLPFTLSFLIAWHGWFVKLVYNHLDFDI